MSVSLASRQERDRSTMTNDLEQVVSDGSVDAPQMSYKVAKALAGARRRSGTDTHAYVFYDAVLTGWYVKGYSPRPSRHENDTLTLASKGRTL